MKRIIRLLGETIVLLYVFVSTYLDVVNGAIILCSCFSAYAIARHELANFSKATMEFLNDEPFPWDINFFFIVNRPYFSEVFSFTRMEKEAEKISNGALQAVEQRLR